mmetsp:Transcript_12794/g.38373  ORF Transcript_12794/g.38373 Transcript_12794/m.38373 type:complete len:385 (+) Transcript_12794:218-1372(+)
MHGAPAPPLVYLCPCSASLREDHAIGLTDVSPFEVPVATAEPKKLRRKRGGAQWAGLLFGDEVPLVDFIDSLQQDAAGSGTDHTPPPQRPRYGFDLSVPLECAKLLTTVQFPKYFSRCALQRHYVHAQNDSGLPPRGERPFGWPSIMMGQRGSRSELHYDQAGLPFWMSVLRGRKLFRVLPATENTHIVNVSSKGDWAIPSPGASGVTFTDSILSEYVGEGSGYLFSALPRLPFESALPAGGPHFGRFPRLCSAVVHQGVIEPGDVIFIPPSSPHAAVNLDDTIAFTSNFLSVTDDPASRAWLERKCSDDYPDSFPTPDHVCAAILEADGIGQEGAHVPQSYFQMAGFTTVNEWCHYRMAGVGDADDRTAVNLRRFCAAAAAAL